MHVSHKLPGSCIARLAADRVHLVRTKVESVLLSDLAVSRLAVNVKIFKGVVPLSGFVKTSVKRLARRTGTQGRRRVAD